MKHLQIISKDKRISIPRDVLNMTIATRGSMKACIKFSEIIIFSDDSILTAEITTAKSSKQNDFVTSRLDNILIITKAIVIAACMTV